MSLTELPGAIVVLLLAATVTPGPNNLLMLRIGSGRLADEAARGALRQILQALAHLMRSRA